MKNKIFMYLFIFTLLLLLFQFINSKNIFDDSNLKVASYEKQVERYKDSIVGLRDNIADLSHFSIDGNDPALTYFEDKGYRVDDLLPLIKDGLYRQNEFKGEQHPLVPYASSEGRRMQINTVRILNHKWIIADFSDGQFWGELFLTYYIDENSQLKYNLEESFLYPL